MEEYLKQCVGEAHIIKNKNGMVYIGADLPDEYTHSNYTYILKGANAKAKANTAQGLPEMLVIANEKEYEDIERYNVFLRNYVCETCRR